MQVIFSFWCCVLSSMLWKTRHHPTPSTFCCHFTLSTMVSMSFHHCDIFLAIFLGRPFVPSSINTADQDFCTVASRPGALHWEQNFAVNKILVLKCQVTGILPHALLSMSQKGRDEFVLWLIASVCVACFMGAWVARLYSGKYISCCLSAAWDGDGKFRNCFLINCSVFQLKLTAKVNYLHPYRKLWTIDPV